MRKLILLSVLAIAVASCGYEIRKKPEPPKPKLTKEQIRKQEYEQRLEDYNVQAVGNVTDNPELMEQSV